MTCDKCGHAPSERIREGDHFRVHRCDCPCHDAADAGPRLLEALKLAEWGAKCRYGAVCPVCEGLKDDGEGHEDGCSLAAAIAEAEPKKAPAR